MMMMRLIAAFLAVTLLCGQTYLPGWPPGAFDNTAAMAPASGGGGYIGPGDIVSSTTLPWGSTAYCWSAAYASGHGNAFTVQRSSDSTSTTITCLSNGKTDAATLSTFCNATVCVVTELFDQTGNGKHWNVQQLAYPAIVVSGIDGLPSINCGTDSSGTTNHQTGLDTTATFTVAQPITVVAVAQNNGGNVSQEILGTSNFDFTFDANGTANQLCLYNGAGPGCASGITDGSPHSLQALYSGSSSVIYANGSTSGTTVNPGTTGLGGTALTVCIAFNNGSRLQGYISEVGLWPSSASTALITNASTRYGGI